MYLFGCFGYNYCSYMFRRQVPPASSGGEAMEGLLSAWNRVHPGNEVDPTVAMVFSKGFLPERGFD